MWEGGYDSGRYFVCCYYVLIYIRLLPLVVNIPCYSAFPVAATSPWACPFVFPFVEVLASVGIALLGTAGLVRSSFRTLDWGTAVCCVAPAPCHEIVSVRRRENQPLSTAYTHGKVDAVFLYDGCDRSATA